MQSWLKILYTLIILIISYLSMVKIDSVIYKAIFIFLLCFIMYLISLIYYKKTNSKELSKLNIKIWLIIYIAILLNLTIFGRSDFNGFIWNKLDSDIEYYIENFVNLIPFKSILYIINNSHYNLIIYNILGNFLALSPLAFFLSILPQKKVGNLKYLLIVFLSSLSIELMQLISLCGSFDIDDIILNTIGSFLFFILINISFINAFLNNIFNFAKNKLEIKKIIITITITVLILMGVIISDIYYNENKHKDDFYIEINEHKSNIHELFYEDDYYEYYLTNYNSNDVSVYINHDKYSLQEVLDNKLTGIESLKYEGLRFNKVSKYENVIYKTEGRKILTYDIKNKNILDLSSIATYQNHDIIEHIVFIIPKKKGKTKFTINIIDSDTNKKESYDYNVTVDKNLSVKINELF